MACRCQERREAIRRAIAAKTVTSLKKEAAFVARTSAQDLLRAINIRRNNPKG
ncbi:hypothetical protein GGR23_000843 [Gellertiella hungarica]|uniref:Uncharacterized protein n=1 Tax=Gellertiella hungarica TaxID=1572859 RepID=A0A7W6NJW0_9HYPH|nr:hypothetical protein [Gellertiella hungarica]